MAYDTALAERIRVILDDQKGVSERAMFGGLAFMVGGKMLVGVQGSTLMARVGPERYHDALASPHVRPMDFTGRPMTGYIYVDPTGIESDQELRSWVEWSFEYVTTISSRKGKSRED